MRATANTASPERCLFSLTGGGVPQQPRAVFAQAGRRQGMRGVSRGGTGAGFGARQGAVVARARAAGARRYTGCGGGRVGAAAGAASAPGGKGAAGGHVRALHPTCELSLIWCGSATTFWGAASVFRNPSPLLDVHLPTRGTPPSLRVRRLNGERVCAGPSCGCVTGRWPHGQQSDAPPPLRRPHADRCPWWELWRGPPYWRVPI